MDGESEEAIPVVGSSTGSRLVIGGVRYRPGRLTPRGRSDLFLAGLAAAADAGYPLPEFRWPVSAVWMGIPLLGAVWRRRFLARFGVGLGRLGYRVESVTRGKDGRSLVVHARRRPVD